MKLDIIYRCCNNEMDSSEFKSVRPSWFNKIKCLNSFLRSARKASDVIGEVIFLHDGPKGELFQEIPDTFNKVCINVKNNEQSLLETFKIADQLTNHIYFVEDDYLHLENSIDVIYAGLLNFKLVTGYDHLDRYIRSDDITLGKDYVAFSQKTNCHWRTTESTCCTWATTREMWINNIREAAYTFKLQDRELFRHLTIQKNIRLWTPIPGVTTQVDSRLTPGINWKNI